MTALFRLLPALVLAGALLAALAVLDPGIAAPERIAGLAAAAAVVGLAALGQTLTLLSGRTGVDLSQGAVAVLAGGLTQHLAREGEAGLAAGVAAGLAAGLLVGLVNGVGRGRFGIPALPLTLATGAVVAAGAGLLPAPPPLVGAAAETAALLVRPVLPGLPAVAAVWIGTTLAAALLLAVLRFGWFLRAVGASRRAARLAGVPVAGVVTAASALSGLLAAAAGVALVAVGPSGVAVGPVAGGFGLTLSSLLAVLLGGTSLRGATGGVVGSAVGAAAVALLVPLSAIQPAAAPFAPLAAALLLLVLVLVHGRQERLRP